MKYMLLVHHNEQAFGKLSETERQQMLHGFQGRVSAPSKSGR
jgi:hypothetical protein